MGKFPYYEKKIKSYCAKRGGILGVYVFGSQARGDTHGFSDVDLAFLTKRKLTLEEHAKLANDMMKIFGDTNVDVILLNDAPVLLKYEVIREGKLLYRSQDDRALNNYESGVIREYFDTEYLRRVQDLYMREKFLGIPSGF